MKIVLHYQVKDFRRFVLENLEKRGYVLAAGTEPMMANMDNMDDPEAVVMEVLVEERLEAVFNQLEFQKTLPVPAALPAPAQPQQEHSAVPLRGRYKKQNDPDLSEEEQAKVEARRAQWRKSAQAKREKKQAEAEAQHPNSEPRHERIERRNAAVASRTSQEVVAPAESPFLLPPLRMGGAGARATR